jgi:hypothetical protein
VSWAEWQSSPGVILPWRAGPYGQRQAQGYGVVKDGIAAAADASVACRWISRCPVDALAKHGDAFGWPRTPGETDNEYRARLRLSWHLARWRGTATGIIDAFAAIGLSNVEVKESFTTGWGRHTGSTARQRWINVIVRQPHDFGTDFSFRWGDGTLWGDGSLYGVNGDPRLLALIVQLVQRQKPAHSHCEWIAIVLAGDVIELNGPTDGNPDGGASRVAYIPVPAL